MNAPAPKLDLAAIRAVLATVPDPEVPVLTLDDLGIIRDVAIDGDDIVVTLTPTYMGCPATFAIRKMVSDALVEAGYPRPVLKEQLSPAWTTDWISDDAKARLRAYGIAPPAGDSPKDCPLCGSANTQLVSRFGSTACKALYRCGDCGEPFEYFKCH
ncbi:MAG: 1,2-phenylacetyl-CoA epoxidase subunit PaaD [Cardiobacteriaceae bacterium]|nr:1,2-phenylacetyl-CoA epoxidase subunit PaaD [Cardiobacteriaceae bacterium]